MDLQEALHECRISYEHLKQRAIDAQAEREERDRLLMHIGSIQNGNPLDEVYVKSDKDFDLVKSYLTRIQELEGELVRIRSSNHLRHENSDDFLDSEDDGTHSRNLFMDSDIKIEETDDVVEDVEKELEHSSIQEELDRELKELDKRLEQKEAEMKRFSSGDTSVLKQHYEKKVHELEHEKRALQKEIEDLRHNLSNISSSSDDSAQKLKEEYLQKLNVFEKQVAELKKKQDAQAQLLRQKQKSDEAAKRLQDEIQRIKTQKVQLQHKIKQESEQFRHWKASREKEVLQLKKEGRINEYEMHKLLAHNQRQKLVTIVDDLVVEWLPVNQQVRGSKILGHINPRSCSGKLKKLLWATKRLKDLLDSRKASREQSGAGSIRGPGIPALAQTIEHELEVTIGVHEVRTEYERQMKERAKMAEEIARLKEETLIEKHQNFRCQLRDREVDCREKDSEIRELKEKVVNLVRQLELKKAEFNRRETLMKLALERQTEEKSSGSMANNSDGHAYDLRPKGSRNSTILDSGLYVLELPEDMDTSYDQHLYSEDAEDAEWVHPTERKKRQSRKRNSNKCSCSKKSLPDIEM